MTQRYKTNALWKRDRNWLAGVLFGVIIILASLTVFINMFSLAFVDGESMFPTLEDGQYALIYNSKDAKRGEIIVLKAWDKSMTQSVLIKRLIAVEGQKLAFIADGDLVKYQREVALYFYEGEELVLFEESYINAPMLEYSMGKSMFNGNFSVNEIFGLEGGDFPKKISQEQIDDYDINVQEIPKNQIFFMGDNRNDSSDSRNSYGTVKKSTIMGRLKWKIKMSSAWEKILLTIY